MAHDPTEDALALVRRLFLDERHAHGCAEATFVALKTAFALDEAADPSMAMALNGGIAYSGGACGAITGAALAIGALAGRRLPDHADAKRVARGLTMELMEVFSDAFGATDCRSLIGMGLRTPEEHAAFLASDIWRDRCLRQIELVVTRTVPLADPVEWARALARVEAANARTVD